MRITGGAVDRVAALLRRAEAAGGLAHLALVLEILGILASLPARQGQPIASPAFAAAVRPAVYRGVREAVGLVFENFSQPLSLSHALVAAGMSRATFCRQFRRHTGRTFAAFVAEVRLREVARRLAESEDSVSEIAFGTGYATLSHFHHQFRRLYGTSPRRFRDAVRRGRRPAGALTPRRAAGCGSREAGARRPATARPS